MKMVVMGIVLMVSAVLLRAEQTNSDALLTLIVKKQGQEQALIDAYGKVLDSMMAELKNKGDLDNYIIVDNEKKRFVAEKTVPFPASAKDMFKVPVNGYFKARITLLKQYIVVLDGLMKVELKANRVDSAKEAKDEKDKAVAELADLESRMPKEVAPISTNTVKMVNSVDVKRAKIVSDLVGTWDVSVGQNNYRAKWVFKKDGTAQQGSGVGNVKGEWAIEDGRIRFTWNNGTWDAFSLPLSKSVNGDSWAGSDKVRATKIR